MILKSLSIKRLYDTLDLDVKFNREITLLVGINGSGKTSVLNVIDWLLKPDFRRLVSVQYRSLALKFAEGATDYELVARKTQKQMILSITGPSPHLAPITARLRASYPEIDNDADESHVSMSLEKHEMPMWELLKSFSKPTVISLDRTISAESDQVSYVELPPHTKRPPRFRSPIAHVQEVTSSKYAEFRAKSIANDNELKASIVMSALQDPEMAFRGEAIKPMTSAEIARLEKKVSTYLYATIKSADVRRQVQRFFRASRGFTERQHRTKEGHGFVFDFVSAQYRQIESLAKAFNEFEKKNALAFKSLSDYLSTVNRFFKDSNKELSFDEGAGRLVFSSIISPNKKQSIQSITHLSSGERQMLVLFTFLAFVSNPKSVFIVDEPELSLHPKWQSDFMGAFLAIKPEATQLLLATHSPDIVGKFKGSCVALRGSSR